MKWNKRTFNVLDSGYKDVEYSNDIYTISVSYGAKQGYPGSNQVNIFKKNYGGWLMDTPKNFSNKKQTNNFVNYAKKRLAEGKEGYKVPFPSK